MNMTTIYIYITLAIHALLKVCVYPFTWYTILLYSLQVPLH